MSGIQDNADRDNAPHLLGNELMIGFESVAIQNSKYAYTDSKKPAADTMVSAPLLPTVFSDTFTKNISSIKLNDGSANYSEDDIISAAVAKNIEEGVADINAGRTYTSDQVKKMLGLH